MRTAILTRTQTRYAYTEHQIVLLNHGINILICDGINMAVLLMISALAGDLFQGAVYLLTFTFMRKHSGEWHASTRVRCFLSYQAVFILMLLCTKWIHESWVIILLYLSSVSYIIMNAPVQHIYNPLSEYEKCENRRKLMKNLLLISIAFACFSLNKSHYAFTISYASVWNAACMALLKHSNKWRRS